MLSLPHRPWCCARVLVVVVLGAVACAGRGLGQGADAAAPTAATDPDDRGRLGIWFVLAGDAVLVTRVQPGSGAAGAGLVPGDVLVAVDGAPVAATQTGVRAQLMGPTGTSVELQIAGPWGAAPRQVAVARGVAPADPEPRTANLGAALESAVRRGRPRQARQAARAFIEARGRGEPSATHLGPGLAYAAPKRPRAVRAAVEVLASAAAPTDIELQRKLGLAHAALGQWESAAEALTLVDAGRPADVAVGAWRGDAGGEPVARARLAEAMWHLGREAEARSIIAALALGRDAQAVIDGLGLPPALGPGEPATTAWRGELARLPEVELALVDGAAWRLEDHADQVVLMAFWATWCGPCRQELPGFQALLDAREGRGLTAVAISTDTAEDAPKVPALAEKLGLDMPVAVAPDQAPAFDVTGLPSVRVVGRGGALRYAASGYSPDSLARLADQIDALLDEPTGAAPVLGTARAVAGASVALRSWVPVSGARDLDVGADAVVLRADGGAVGTWHPTAEHTWDLSTPPDLAPPSPDEGGGAGDRVTWWGGPVVVVAPQLQLVARDPLGALRWRLTTEGRVSDLVVAPDPVHGQLLWVATPGVLAAVDATGRLVLRQPAQVTDLVATDQGVRAVGPTQGLVGDSRGLVAVEGGGQRVDAAGGLGGPVAHDLVVGRFGADGTPRRVVARADGAVVALSAAGSPAAVLTLERAPRMAVLDVDADGHDELLILVPAQGVAVVDLALP